MRPDYHDLEVLNVLTGPVRAARFEPNSKGWLGRNSSRLSPRGRSPVPEAKFDKLHCIFTELLMSLDRRRSNS
jgi:hypothetical protein